MARDVTANMIAQLEADVLQPFIAVKLDFDGDPVRAWTGTGDITIASEDYFGAGHLLTIDAVSETASVQANGANISLSGVPTDLISAALNENYQGRDAIIYFGVISNGAVVSIGNFHIIFMLNGVISHSHNAIDPSPCVE